MRLEAPDRIAPGFEEDMHAVSGGLADRSYFRTLADNAVQTIGWLQTHGVEFVTPVYYLSAGPARIQPVGGGRTIVEKLLAAARSAGVEIRYEREAKALVMAKDGRISGIVVQSADGARHARRRRRDPRVGRLSGQPRNDARAFRRRRPRPSNSSRPERNSTPATASAWPRSRARASPATGTACTSNRSIRAARAPRRSCWSIPTASSSIRTGVVSSTKAAASSTRPGSISPAISISRDREVSPMRSSTAACSISKAMSARSGRTCRRIDRTSLEDLAVQIGIPARNLQETVDAFNAAATGDMSRNSTRRRCDGLARPAN